MRRPLPGTVTPRCQPLSAGEIRGPLGSAVVIGAHVSPCWV